MSHPGELLSAWLDGEVTPDESDLVRLHLGTCDDCRREIGDLVAARRAVRSLPMLESSAFVVPPRSGAAPSRWRAVAAVAATVAVLGAGVLLGRPDHVTADELIVPHVELSSRTQAGVAP